MKDVSTKEFNVQVEKNYYNKSVDSLSRFISYHYQAKLICEVGPKNILEVGKGGGALSSYLKSRGFDITTCDFDESLKPDHVADIRELPFDDNSFETVVAFEILEHIPFDDFEKALNELNRVSNKNVIISIPYASLSIHFVFKVPLLRSIIGKKYGRVILRVPQFLRKHKFNGQHYWEMGKKQYSKRKIEKTLKKRFIIKKQIVPFLNDYHQFYVLKNK